MTTAVAIICKTPRAGSSKTRMIPQLGAEKAAALAGAFLTDIAAVIADVGRATPCKGFAVYAPEGSEAELARYIPDDFGRLCRQGTSLETVLLGATRHLLGNGFGEVLLVNADSPTLPAEEIQAAIDALRPPGDRVVLGPASDGGYYLIGLKQAHAQLFADITWSTDVVLAQTRQRAAEIALPVVELGLWYDVDDGASLAMLEAELGGTPPAFARSGRAPPRALATRALLLEPGAASR